MQAPQVPVDARPEAQEAEAAVAYTYQHWLCDAVDWLRRHPNVDPDTLSFTRPFPINGVLMEWEALFESISTNEAWRVALVALTDARVGRYGLSNAQLMSRMRPRLVDALRGRSREHRSPLLFLGSKFISTMTTDVQQSFFGDICALPFLTNISLGDGDIPQVTIDTPALLHALSQMDGQLRSLGLHNFALASSVQVQQLADIIVANKDTLFCVLMPNIECPVQVGFLDPILDALSQLQDKCGRVWRDYYGWIEPLPSTLVMSSRTRPTCSLVSPKSLRSFLGSSKVKRNVELPNMGLSDNHCLAIAEHAHTWLANGDDRQSSKLDLHSNPGITEDGYKALVEAAYRNRDFPGIILDDKHWEDEINFVRKMNRRYGRFDYLDDDGVFPSRERWLEWLGKAVNIRKKSDRLSCIYCTLREHPNFIN